MTPEEFKAWRKRMGWTQAEAARELGVTRQHIIRLERGIGSKGEPLVVKRLEELAVSALEKLPETRMRHSE